MLQIKEYVLAESLKQAYELNQAKTNRILGGTGWLKMGEHHVNKAIDLSALHLDAIEEDEEQFRIGCMVTLRQLEKSEALNSYTEGAVRESVRHIIGTQFRNCVTVGGSIFGRFGFSDVLTLFLTMDCSVELYHRGVMPLAQFAELPYDRDILVRLIVPKSQLRTAYHSFRNQSTDFPVLTCAAALAPDGQVRIALGARPGKAQLRCYSLSELRKLTETAIETEAVSGLTGEIIQQIAKKAQEEFRFGGNMRAGEAYRRTISAVLVTRALTEIDRNCRACETICGIETLNKEREA